MKSRFKLVVAIILSLSCMMSCGKYGYDFKDGYQDGDKEASDIITDTSMHVADKSMYHRARIFPGLIGENEKRISDTVVTFNLNYVNVTALDLKVNTVPRPIFSTGLYAPAGENVKITVPQGIYGLTVQVGIHMNDISSYDPKRRDPIIYTRKELFPGDNYVKNLYGGTIWILANNPKTNPLGLKFSGAVKSPDFILGESNPEKWLAEVEKIDVPWIEVRSKRVVFSVPRTLILSYKDQIKNLDQALIQWNEIYERDFYDWMGLSSNTTDLKNRYPDLPERAVLEIQLPDGVAAHSGSPWVASMNSHWFFMFLNKDYLLNPANLPEVSWGAFHEVGHNYQQPSRWSWSGLGETTNNLFIWKAAHRLNRPQIANHPAINEAFTRGIAYASLLTSKNIVSDNLMTSANAPFIKILPFLQIFHQAKGKNGESGWDFMTYLYKNARNNTQSLNLDQAKRDFFYRNLCEFTGKDWRRFCKAWGIQTSALVQQEMSAKYDGIELTYWTYNPLTKTGGNGTINPKEDLLNTQWKMLSISTEEKNGEGPSNGNGIHMLDGNNNTFWHTQWQNGWADIPHTAVIELNTNEIVKGFYLIPRSPDGRQRPRSIEIQISKDNANYTTLTNADLEDGYSFSMANNEDRKEFRLKNRVEIRYIKIVFREHNYSGNSDHAVAEFGAFYDID